MNKIKIKNKPLFIFLCCLFTFGLGLIFATSVKSNSTINAQEINGSNDYLIELNIDNYSYYVDFSDFDYQRWFGVAGNTSFYVDVYLNGTNYNRLQIVNDVDNIGGIEISLKNTDTYEIFTIFQWGVGDSSPSIWYKNKIPLYNGNEYTIIANSLTAIYCNFTNKVNGYYTFNRDLVGLPFEDYNWVDSGTDYQVYGTFVYQTELELYLFDNMTLSPSNSYISFLMKRPNGSSEYFEIIDSFEDDALRYIYLDSQYIDTFLYEWLELNGDFTFSYAGLGYNNTFWDVINAYVNIPINLITSMLNISIFNTGITILVVFATIVAIALAFKVIRIFNWG